MLHRVLLTNNIIIYKIELYRIEGGSCLEGLELLEGQLTDLINIDKKNWTTFYLLLKDIEDKELYRPRYKSFTQWVKDFCVKTKTHEATVWNRKKAGRVYEAYVKFKADQGIIVKPIDKINISVNSLVLLDKINRYDEKIFRQLVDKVINKEITQKDLREVYQRIRPTDISKNPHDKREINLTPTLINNAVITENDIVASLCDLKWLSVKTKNNRFKSPLESKKIRTFTNFRLSTEITQNNLKMDMLISENVTSDNNQDLYIHGIDIKVGTSTYLKDSLFDEYARFVDYLWLAIPTDHVKSLKTNNIKYKNLGIIAVEGDGTVTIIKPAIKLSCDLRHQTLKNIVLKLM